MYDLTSDNEKKELLVDLLHDVLGPHRNHYGNKNQITFDCPQCCADKGVSHDGKGNLEINYQMGKFNCWACGEETGMHGGINKLMKKWASDIHYQAFKKIRIRFSYENDGEEHQVIEKPELVLPKEYISMEIAPDLGTFKPFHNYLRERRITPEIVKQHNIGCALEGKYANRIIIPSYSEDDELEYFTTRTIDRKVRKFKYLNCEVKKETIIFNLRFIDWEKYLFIVEGPFDHIVLPNSIPLLGKKMSDLMFSTIYENAESNIVLVLDPDAWDKTRMIYNKLDGGRLMNKIMYVKMPKDANGYDLDVSKYNEVYGQQGLFSYVKSNMRKLLD